MFFNDFSLQKTTTNSNGNYNLEVTNTPKDKRLAKEFTDEDESTDPLQKILPKIQFNCKGKSEGYYADNEFCEVFHYCKVIITLCYISIHSKVHLFIH